MPGMVKLLIDRILEERSKGDPIIRTTTRTKLILKGIDPDQFTPVSDDDPAMVARVRAAAIELGVVVR